MKCKLCGSQILNKVKIKDGYICQHCYESFTDGVKNTINKFTNKQLVEINQLLEKPNEKAWAECGNIKLTDNSIQITNKEIKIAKIRNIRINFHPKFPNAKTDTATGIVTIVIETDNPHYLFEEPVSDKYFNVKYSIMGKNISYVYPESILNIVRNIQKTIDSGQNNLNDFKNEWIKNKSNKQKGSSKNNTNTNNSSSYKEAVKILHITEPFTKDDIKMARKKLIKIHHPDVGGTPEMCNKINEAYELLLNYAL